MVCCVSAGLCGSDRQSLQHALILHVHGFGSGTGRSRHDQQRHGHHLIRGCRQDEPAPGQPAGPAGAPPTPAARRLQHAAVPPAQPWLQAAQRESQPHPQPSAVRPEAFRQVPVSGGVGGQREHHRGPSRRGGPPQQKQRPRQDRRHQTPPAS